ncbi:hypothetical protein ACWDZ4_25880 [Streptomyces sp. NPDC003016]
MGLGDGSDGAVTGPEQQGPELDEGRFVTGPGGFPHRLPQDAYVPRA